MKNRFLKVLILCFFGIFEVSYCQDKPILVEYESIKGEITNKEKLISKKDKAIYITDSLFIENDQTNRMSNVDRSNQIRISEKYIKLDLTKYYSRINSPIIYFNLKHNEQNYLVKDSLPTFDWELIEDDTKIIGGYLCKKAKINYRGSTIIAYYTEAIPIFFGPWKFRGLPGLILELYNIHDKVTNYWIANKIIYPYTRSLDFEIPNDIPVVTLKTIVEKREKEIKERMKFMSTRAPKGAILQESKITRTGLEKKYEWEN